MRQFRTGALFLICTTLGWAGCIPTTNPASKADFDGDGKIDAGDLDLLKEVIGEGNPDNVYDLNGDGVVDQRDVDLLIEYICEKNGGTIDARGACCLPEGDQGICCDNDLNGSFDQCTPPFNCISDEDCLTIEHCRAVCDLGQGLCVCGPDCTPGETAACACDNALKEMPACYQCDQNSEWQPIEYVRDPCQCLSNDECQAGMLCDPANGKCVYDCRTALVDPCLDLGLVCDNATGFCVADGGCQADSECANMNCLAYCTPQGKCECSMPCKVDDDCAFISKCPSVCDETRGLCVCGAICQPGDTLPCPCDNALKEMPTCFICSDDGAWLPIETFRDPCRCLSSEECQDGTTCDPETGTCVPPSCQLSACQTDQDCVYDSFTYCNSRGCCQWTVQCKTDDDCALDMNCPATCDLSRGPGLCICLEACLHAGETYGGASDSQSCCEGLKPIEGAITTGPGGCAYPDPSLWVCAACGDGQCGLGENPCNCPADCTNESCTPGATRDCECNNPLKVTPICWECNEKGVWQAIAYFRDPCQCLDTAECADLTACDTATGQCVSDCRKAECGGDAECNICGSYNVCDTGTGLCVLDCRNMDVDPCWERGMSCDYSTGLCTGV